MVEAISSDLVQAGTSAAAAPKTPAIARSAKPPVWASSGDAVPDSRGALRKPLPSGAFASSDTARADSAASLKQTLRWVAVAKQKDLYCTS